MSRYDLTCRADYGAFLQAQAGAFMGVEAALDEADAETHLPDWHERRRTIALRSDLNLMGLAFPEPAPAASRPPEAVMPSLCARAQM
ncbi:hypothetical protein D3C72_621000 [compost metagenome]